MLPITWWLGPGRSWASDSEYPGVIPDVRPRSWENGLRTAEMADLIEAVVLVGFIFLMGVALGVIAKSIFGRSKKDDDSQ
jgi:hypothetical protein